MKILVTGGAGYVGTELVSSLAQNDDVSSIVVYDNLSRGNFNTFLGTKIKGYKKVKFIEGDILDTRLLKKNLEGVAIVYHLAAKVTTPFANTDPHLFEQSNNWGTAELVYAIESSKVEKLIYLSSTSVYGASDQRVNETSDLRPRTFYGISKLRGEKHVERLLNQGRAVILRCGNVYGYSKSMRFDAVINKFAFETNFFNRITIQGSGQQSRAFIHINDLSQVLNALCCTEVKPDIYNLVMRNLTVLDLLDGFKKLRPSLEFIFVDQHLSLRNLEVETALYLNSQLDLPKVRPITNELSEFLNRFTF